MNSSCYPELHLLNRNFTKMLRVNRILAVAQKTDSYLIHLPLDTMVFSTLGRQKQRYLINGTYVVKCFQILTSTLDD